MSRYIKIDDRLFQVLKGRYPNSRGHFPSGSWQTSRYIQIFIEGCSEEIHYEYTIDTNWEGRIELHFEGDRQENYHDLIEYLTAQTQNIEHLAWQEWECGYRCQCTNVIASDGELLESLSEMMGIFSGRIETFREREQQPRVPMPIECRSLPLSGKHVALFELKYDDVLQLPLSIPDYQRIYCWDEEHLICLLDDIFAHTAREGDAVPAYRLGTLILHAHGGAYDIIDGQQRLISLALLLAEMGIPTSLLQERLYSRLSLDYIAYNKYVIQGYLKQRGLNRPENAKKIRELLEFSVLVLQNASIDLAFAFFSNENSRGKSLSDYDLLKAHHLRYFPKEREREAEAYAEDWARMIEAGRGEAPPNYACALDTYIYRLRR